MYKLLSLLLLLALMACGGDQVATAPENTYEAATEMAQNQLETLQQNNDRDVHEVTTLRAMLPETLLGMARKSISANGVGAAGFQMANANATYQTEGDRRRITVTITDGMGGNLPGMGMINSFTVDKEEGTKTTKTIKVGGKKAIREYDTARKSGSLSVVFPQSIVRIDGRHLEDIDDLNAAFDALGLHDL